MTRRARTDIVIIFTALIVAGTMGYLEGKHAADRWYAQHDFTRLCLAGTSADDLASVWNLRGEWVGIMHADGTRPIFTVDVDGAEMLDIEVGFVPILYGHAVKLIPPIKVRTAAPVASIEDGTTFRYGDSGFRGVAFGVTIIRPQKVKAKPPVASVEEPR